MTNTLYDLFVNHKSARVIWNTPESSYESDDAGSKKYVVGKWLQFHIVDSKPIMDQVHEYENMVADVLSEDMKMCEILQANILLEKFPPTWNYYRNHLKHKKRYLTLQELINHMRMEEANHLKDKKISNSSVFIKANLVEPSESSKDRFQHKAQQNGIAERENRTLKEMMNAMLLSSGQETEWLRNLLGDVPLWGSSALVSLHCDSQAVIGIAKNYAYNGKRRHIRIRYDMVQEL
ncbi:hypothetical protein Sango_2419100 [Sesamum angolense]|uniref:Polyprotein n=1 Tax=Sesamum angolense TaxID=2727404 RepID=A0AAE1W7D7_9LAMI|nr:hypothetical protein Sango_2419100 [Sesamum angolense]